MEVFEIQLNRKDENEKHGNETARRDGHLAFSALFGIRPDKSVRADLRSFSPRFTDNHNHARRLAALTEWISRKLQILLELRWSPQDLVA
jgi:hypothetical protein